MLEVLLTPKDQLITIPEKLNCQEALDLMEEHRLRNAPVVDRTGHLFRGNIYRYHIYKHFYQYPEDQLTDLSVTRFLKNSSRVVHINDSFIHLIFAIKDLPYVAVLNEENSFAGIIRHSSYQRYFSEGFGGQELGYLLEVNAKANNEENFRVHRQVQRQFKTCSIIKMSPTSFKTPGYVIYGLSKHVNAVKLNGFIHQIKRRGFEVKLYSI